MYERIVVSPSMIGRHGGFSNETVTGLVSTLQSAKSTKCGLAE